MISTDLFTILTAKCYAGAWLEEIQPRFDQVKINFIWKINYTSQFGTGTFKLVYNDEK